MIDSITGIIQRKEPTNLFIDMNGLVFNISICLKDYEELPDLNQEITMLTYLTLSISISIFMNWYNKKMAIKEK